MGELDGKVAIVTGAGRLRGIGRAAAVELARLGADVVVTGTGRNPDTFPPDEKAVDWKDVESTAEQIREQGHRDLIITFRQGEVHANGELIRLPPTEYEIFYHLVTNAGRVVTSQTMMDDIWGEEYRAEPYFLTSRVSRLQETLQRHSQTEDLILQEESGGYSLTMTKGNIF